MNRSRITLREAEEFAARLLRQFPFKDFDFGRSRACALHVTSELLRLLGRAALDHAQSKAAGPLSESKAEKKMMTRTIESTWRRNASKSAPDSVPNLTPWRWRSLASGAKLLVLSLRAKWKNLLFFLRCFFARHRLARPGGKIEPPYPWPGPPDWPK